MRGKYRLFRQRQYLFFKERGDLLRADGEELIVYGDADALLAAAHAEYAAEIDPVFKRVFGDLKLEPFYDLA